ncbi:MAG TPA: hypothetical protein DCL24_05440 [Erysipelotrichaceae bacterium]|nr:hypothetical protein [Erysipelotrichaceae bacterium]HAV18970.1 hypothetical protein [Erysipelotrichaceae bacterium]HBG85794.1 hypothetical protein [Erysipelotrichaceae bacterium]HCG97307.1 hypothetical protein [Erysipelotrichaceae bacterium]HCJ37263.1 hypothetical protein [Erysipelotrichaceae bacterium]
MLLIEKLKDQSLTEQEKRIAQCMIKQEEKPKTKECEILLMKNTFLSSKMLLKELRLLMSQSRMIKQEH